MDRRTVLKGMGAVAVAAVGSRNASAAGEATDYNAIIEGAKKEKPLSAYTVFGEEFWPFIIEPLKQKYPWLTVEYQDMGSQEIVQRYLLEKSAGSKTADFLLLASPQSWQDLSQRREVLQYTSPEALHLPDWAVSYGGVYGILVDAEVFGWNKKLLSPELVPGGMEDFAKKVQANPDLFHKKILTFNALDDVYRELVIRRLEKKHGPKIWEWLNIIGPHVRFEKSSGGMAEKLLSGECVVAMGIPLARCLTTVANSSRAALFAWDYMKDGTGVGPRQAGITAASANPNSAKLLLDFILSPEGQAAVAKSNKTPIRADLAGGVGHTLTLKTIQDTVGAGNALDVSYTQEIADTHTEFVEKYQQAFGIKS